MTLNLPSVGGGTRGVGFELCWFFDDSRLVIFGFCDDNGVDVMFLFVVAWDVTVPVGAAGTTTATATGSC